MVFHCPILAPALRATIPRSPRGVGVLYLRVPGPHWLWMHVKKRKRTNLGFPGQLQCYPLPFLQGLKNCSPPDEPQPIWAVGRDDRSCRLPSHGMFKAHFFPILRILAMEGKIQAATIKANPASCLSLCLSLAHKCKCTHSPAGNLCFEEVPLSYSLPPKMASYLSDLLTGEFRLCKSDTTRIWRLCGFRLLSVGLGGAKVTAKWVRYDGGPMGIGRIFVRGTEPMWWVS